MPELQEAIMTRALLGSAVEDSLKGLRKKARSRLIVEIANTDAFSDAWPSCKISVRSQQENHMRVQFASEMCKAIAMLGVPEPLDLAIPLALVPYYSPVSSVLPARYFSVKVFSKGSDITKYLASISNVDLENIRLAGLTGLTKGLLDWCATSSQPTSPLAGKSLD